MRKKGYQPEEIISKLREADISNTTLRVDLIDGAGQR